MPDKPNATEPQWLTSGMSGPSRLWHRGRVRDYPEDFQPYLWMAPSRAGGQVVGMMGRYADTLACGSIGGFTGVIATADEVPPPVVIAEGKASERTLCLRCVAADRSIE